MYPATEHSKSGWRQLFVFFWILRDLSLAGGGGDRRSGGATAAAAALLVLHQEVSKEEQHRDHVHNLQPHGGRGVAAGGRDKKDEKRVGEIGGELRQLTNGDDELVRLQKVADGAGAEDEVEEVVEVHHDVDAAVDHAAPVRIAAGGHHEVEVNNDHNRGVVVDVEERDLTIVVLEDHNVRVSVLEELRDVENPHNVANREIAGVAGLDRVVPWVCIGLERGPAKADRHVKAEDDAHKVVCDAKGS